MLLTASKYASVNTRPGRKAALRPGHHGRPGASSPPRAGLNFFTTRPEKLVHWPEWLWRELREGGFLHEYFRREKARCGSRWASVAKAMQGFRNNTRSDLELKAAVPARDFFRWKATDPDFWCDDSNLRRLRRDDPAAAKCVFNV